MSFHCRIRNRRDARLSHLCPSAGRQFRRCAASRRGRRARRSRARGRRLRPLRHELRPGDDGGGAPRPQRREPGFVDGRASCRAVARGRRGGAVLSGLVVRDAGDPQGLFRPGLGQRRRVSPRHRRPDRAGAAPTQKAWGGVHLRRAVVVDQAGAARSRSRGDPHRHPRAVHAACEDAVFVALRHRVEERRPTPRASSPRSSANSAGSEFACHCERSEAISFPGS